MRSMLAVTIAAVLLIAQPAAAEALEERLARMQDSSPEALTERLAMAKPAAGEPPASDFLRCASLYRTLAQHEPGLGRELFTQMSNGAVVAAAVTMNTAAPEMALAELLQQTDRHVDAHLHEFILSLTREDLAPAMERCTELQPMQALMVSAALQAAGLE